MMYRQEQQRFSYYRDLVTENGSMLYAGKLLERASHRFGNSIALLFKDRSITYRELYQRSCAFTQLLKKKGVVPGSRVLLMVENSIEFYCAYFGVWQTGAVIAPLNIFLKESELAHIVRDAEPVLIITNSARQELFKDSGVCVITVEECINLHEPVNDEQILCTVPVAPDDQMVALLYTSGTTGVPKGVMLSSKNIMTNILQGLSRVPLDFGQRVFAVLPLFHSFAQFACVWASMLTGCTVILVPKIERRAIVEAIKHKPTIFLGVPALYGLLCLLKDIDLSSVVYFISGGDVLPDKIRMLFALLYGRKICNGYGLTETTPVIALHLDDVLAPTSTVGRPLLGISCSIRDEKGNELPVGDVGVLWVKGDNVMLGYYHEPVKTAEILQHGWLNTGDFARIDERGNIVLCGRDKDIIAHKGIKIYPPEIENIIMTHPQVIAVGVIGIDDQESGQVPVAYVQLRKKTEGIQEQLQSLCRQNLAAYKVPRRIIVLDEMPLTATGKVDKKILRAK